MTGPEAPSLNDGGPCTPVSWLRLERYLLGELPVEQRQAVASHLESCDRCRSCFTRIQDDARDQLLALPTTGARQRRRPHWPVLGVAASAFAVILLVALRPTKHDWHPSRVIHSKGGDVALDLVRERQGSVALAPTSFADQDRFKALVTCPPPVQPFVDLVVFQDREASFPGEPAVIACGNRVPYPQAFRITGHSPATVCIVVDDSAPPDRRRLASARPADLGATAACVGLHHTHE